MAVLYYSGNWLPDALLCMYYLTMKKQLARIISNTFNPFALGLIIIILAVVQGTTTIGETVKWSMVSLVFSIIPVFIIVVALVRRKKLDGMFVSPRSQRTGIYLMAACIGAAGLAITWLFEAPMLVRASFTAGVAAILMFMIINMHWKISLHTAFIAASATILSIIYGVLGMLSFILVPAVAWSRIELKQHTLPQVVAGGIGAGVIVIAVFAGCGCLN